MDVQASLLSAPSSPTWPKQGTWDLGFAYELPTSAPPTGANASSFWDVEPTLEPQKLTPETAWAAGLFEGEGYICNPDRDKPRARIMLGLISTDEDVVRRFHGIVGQGNFAGPFAQKGFGTKPFWRWTIYSPAPVSEVLMMLWNGLGARRRATASAALDLVIAGRRSHPRLSDSALLPTPTATYPGGSEEEFLDRKGRQPGGAIHLNHAVEALLPTPSAEHNDGQNPELFLARRERIKQQGINGNGFGLTLGMAVQLLPTPTTQDAANTAGPSQHERNSDPLNVTVQLLPDAVGASTSPPSDAGNTPSAEPPHVQLTIGDG